MDKKFTLYVAESNAAYGFDGELLLKTVDGDKTLGWWLGHHPDNCLRSLISGTTCPSYNSWGWNWNDGCDNARSCRELDSSDDIDVILRSVACMTSGPCLGGEAEEEYDG